MAKTYKRELATAFVALHWGLVAYIVWLEPSRDVSALVDLALGLAIWVYGSWAAAFGLDAWAKQVMPRQEVHRTGRAG